jgi:hypothetical protein
MTVTATGILSLPLDNVRNMVAASPAFQAWVGVTNSTDALSSVFIIATDASGTYPNPVSVIPRPFALINLDYVKRDLRGSGNNPLFAPDSAILLKFEVKNNSGHKNLGADPAIAFLNAIGDIIVDLETQSQAGGGLQILSLSIESPSRKNESFTGEQGDFYEIEIKLSTGYR